MPKIKGGVFEGQEFDYLYSLVTMTNQNEENSLGKAKQEFNAVTIAFALVLESNINAYNAVAVGAVASAGAKGAKASKGSKGETPVTTPKMDKPTEGTGKVVEINNPVLDSART